MAMTIATTEASARKKAVHSRGAGNNSGGQSAENAATI